MKNVIAFVRREKKISQVKLANLIGVSPSYLCKIEKSIIEPSSLFIEKCSIILGVDKSVLFPRNVSTRKIVVHSRAQKNSIWLERKKQGIKQVDLAKKINFSPSYLSKVETGQQDPTDFFKKQCARVLRKKESELFPG